MQNVTSWIYREVKRRLMVGALAPGETLTLRGLAEELKFSQTPVREALLQLASEGILSVSPGRSVRVPELTGHDVEELQRIRLSLEPLAATEAVKRMSEEGIVQLERLHEAFEQSKASGNAETTLQLDCDFYMTLYRAAGMTRLQSIIEGLWAQSGPMMRCLYRLSFIYPHGRNPHRDLVAAVRRRDAAGAASIVEDDIVQHGRVLMERID